MQLSIIIDADGNAAIATVDKLGKTVKSTGDKTKTLGVESTKTATQTRSLATSAGAAQAKVETLSAANVRNAATAKAMGAANRTAAGNMGNLVAQFNDIGVMMAAGQNPLTLALQQGTQISQVIGPMGAAGAVKSLGGAFLGMLNPISLVTIGVIGGGAALAQWATSAFAADEKTLSFEENLDELNASVQLYREYADLAASSTSDLIARFGAAGSKAQTTAGFLREFARVDSIRALDASVAALTTRFGGLSDKFESEIGGYGQTEYQNTVRKLAADLELVEGQAVAVAGALRDMANAEGMSEKIDAANRLSAAFVETFGAVENIPAPLLQVAREAGLIALQAGEITGATVATNTELANQYALYGAMRIESEAQLGAADAILDKLQDQNAMQAAINAHGIDSAEVAALRAEQEREVLEAQLAGLDVAETTKDAIREAFDLSVDLAGQTWSWADAMGGVAAQVSAIMASLASIGGGIIGNAAKQVELQALQAGGSVRDAAVAGRRSTLEAEWSAREAAAENTMAGWLERQLIETERFQFEQGVNLDGQISDARALARPAGNNSGGGRGASSSARSTEREAEAVQRLIAGYEDELALLRETDPIQKEMLRNRETLASASAAERDQIEALITTRDRETASLALQQEQWDATKSVAVGFFDDLRSSGGGLMDALGGIAERLEDIAFQALLLGEGPLAGLFGTAGSGGVIGGILGAAFPNLAPANLNKVPAAGTGRKSIGLGSDLSPKAYQPMIDMMNAAKLPDLSARSKSSGNGQGTQIALAPISFSIDNRGSTPIQGKVTEESDGRGGRAMKLVLADEVGAALNTPGGGARKQLQSYGLRKRSANR